MRKLDGYMQDRVRGLLFGLASGDRIGGPVRMALQLAHSLIERRAFDSSDILQNYLRWWRVEGFDTGAIASAVFEMIAKGQSPSVAVAKTHELSGRLSAGCNPAHRCGPIAMAHFLEDRSLSELACAEAALTHHDPLAGYVSSAVVILCREMIRGAVWDEALQRSQLNQPPAVVRVFYELESRPVSTGGFAPDVLRAALYFVNSSKDFGEAIKAAIKFAGPANYCPVLVGTIGGTRWGAAQVNEDSIDASILPKIHEIAEILAQDWRENDKQGNI